MTNLGKQQPYRAQRTVPVAGVLGRAPSGSVHRSSARKIEQRLANLFCFGQITAIYEKSRKQVNCAPGTPLSILWEARAATVSLSENFSARISSIAAVRFHPDVGWNNRGVNSSVATLPGLAYTRFYSCSVRSDF